MTTQAVVHAASSAANAVHKGVEVAQSATAQTGGLVEATSKAITTAGEGVKAAGGAIADTASAVSNSPTTAKVGGFLADKFMSYWQAAEDITKQIVPQALEAILWVIRVDAIAALFYAFALIGGFYIGYRLIKKWYLHFSKQQAEGQDWQSRDSAGFVKWAGTAVGTVVLCVTMAVTQPTWNKAFDVWSYATIYKPELYLAKLAVDGGTAKLKEYISDNTKRTAK
jgi:hypothetical protein